MYEPQDMTQARSDDLPAAVGERVRAIISSAEGAAEALLAERRRRISEISDGIVARAESVLARLEEADALGGRLEELLSDLREAAGRLDGEAGARAPAQPSARQGEPEQRPEGALGARFVALHMAKVGGRRGEIEAHMRRAFELDDPEPILDEVFGQAAR